MRHFCAGTIINHIWILTAAHCFKFIQSPTELAIQYGSNELNPKQPKVIEVLDIYLHEGYNPTVAVHDIALLKLKKSILNDKTAQAVQLFEGKIGASSQLNATLVGWGLNETNGTLQDELQKVHLTLLSPEECRKVLPAFLHSTNICGLAIEKGQCNGDSGGPLLHGSVQMGIVSWSLKPCARFPGVFTNVAIYKEWIKEKLIL